MVDMHVKPRKNFHESPQIPRPFLNSSSEVRVPYPRRQHPMRYLDRIMTEPTLWLLILMVGGVAATIVYVVLTSITF